jgi:hypothetical protein
MDAVCGSRRQEKGDEGGQLADAEINRIMGQTHATRQQVTDAASRALGGYQRIRDTQLERLKRDKLYDDACRIFDESHKSDFGVIEKQGETWGFRGSYRKMLRLILYSDNWPGPGPSPRLRAVPRVGHTVNWNTISKPSSVRVKSTRMPSQGRLFSAGNLVSIGLFGLARIWRSAQWW